MKIKTILGALLVMLAMLVSCKKETSFGSMKCHVDEVTATSVTATSVTVTFTAETPTNVSGYTVGVVIATSDPISADDFLRDKADAKLGRASYTFSLKGLEPDKKYNVRAYTQAGFGGLITWGDMVSFTTASPSKPALISMEIAPGIKSAAITTDWDDNSLKITEMGVLVAKSEKELETTSATKIKGTGSFNVTGLNPSTQYYVKAYAVNAKGTSYSGVKSFTTKESVIGTKVDLGLSVKWATCNVGASKPEDYGGYYQWAGTADVTSTSINLDWSNCPYCDDSSGDKWTKYVPSGKSSYWSGTGSPDNKTVLDPSDDVASVEWKGTWRMPTDAEWTELMNTSNCSWTWTTINGINGYKVQSKKSGHTDNWIFLPAAGVRVLDRLGDVGSYGYYWSSSLDTYYPYYAYGVNFNSGLVYRSGCGRCDGRSVRPVSE